VGTGEAALQERVEVQTLKDVIYQGQGSYLASVEGELM